MPPGISSVRSAVPCRNWRTRTTSSVAVSAITFTQSGASMMEKVRTWPVRGCAARRRVTVKTRKSTGASSSIGAQLRSSFMGLLRGGVARRAPSMGQREVEREGRGRRLTA